jgi:hypothetical protein
LNYQHSAISSEGFLRRGKKEGEGTFSKYHEREGKVVQIHRCPATVMGTKATGKPAISFQHLARSKKQKDLFR